MGVQAAFAVVAIAASERQASKARKEAKKRGEIERNIAIGQERRGRQRQLREERIQRARITAASEARGVGSSSARSTALGSLATQGAVEGAFQQSQRGLLDQAQFRRQRETDALGRSQFYGNLSSTALQYS